MTYTGGSAWIMALYCSLALYGERGGGGGGGGGGIDFVVLVNITQSTSLHCSGTVHMLLSHSLGSPGSS